MTNGIAMRPAVRLVLLTVGIIVWLLVAWVGRVIVMLLLAAVVFAVLLSAVVDWVTTKLKIRRGLVFALLFAAGFVAVFLTLWIRGPSIIEQFADLQSDLPQAAHKFLERLNGYQGGRWLLAQWSDYTQTSGNLTSAPSRIFQGTLGGFREICGNECMLKRDGDGIHGCHKCLSCRSVELAAPLCFERLYYETR